MPAVRAHDPREQALADGLRKHRRPRQGTSVREEPLEQRPFVGALQANENGEGHSIDCDAARGHRKAATERVANHADDHRPVRLMNGRNPGTFSARRPTPLFRSTSRKLTD